MQEQATTSATSAAANSLPSSSERSSGSALQFDIKEGIFNFCDFQFIVEK